MSYTKGFEISCDQCNKVVFIPVNKSKLIDDWLEYEELWYVKLKRHFCSMSCYSNCLEDASLGDMPNLN